jgi:L-alanine-DL-glutamate epimerase-like enolase superfamily enzyme
VEAVRRAIGPDVGFMIDVNTVFQPQQAAEFGQALLPFDPYWFGGTRRRRTPPGMPGCAAAAAECHRENLYLTQGFEPLWTHRACDYVMPDILRCGGLGQTRQICLEALRHGVIPSPHNFSSGVGLAATLHLMAALPQTEWLEFDPTGTAVYEELFVEPLVLERGRVRVPTAPGLGVRLTEALFNPGLQG